MRVFVLGTGRCGSVTFSKACQHIKNYTVTHEGKAGRLDLDFPNNHIEVDPHLFWNIHELTLKYKDAVYVHLIRDKIPCVLSLASRASVSKHWIPFVYQKEYPEKEDAHLAAERFYRFVNDSIMKMILPYRFTYLQIPIGGYREQILHAFREFWGTIGASGDFVQALREFDTHYNARVKK